MKTKAAPPNIRADGPEGEMMKTMKNAAELRDEMLDKVAGGDQVHYDELAAQCYADMLDCIEQNLDSQMYLSTFGDRLRAAADRGCVTAQEARDLMQLAEGYARRLRQP